MITDKEINNLEKKIDEYIIKKINPIYPRYKYIHHLNLAHISVMLHYGILFTPLERYYNLSLSANINWAYKKLSSESTYDLNIDTNLYFECINNIIDGSNYAILCDEFTKLRLNKSQILKINDFNYTFTSKSMPRLNALYAKEYNSRQQVKSILKHICDSNIEHKNLNELLSKEYCSYLAERLESKDYTDYDRSDWFKLTNHIMSYCMESYATLYKNNFELNTISKYPLLVEFTQNHINKVSSIYNISYDSTKKILNDFIYKPNTNSLYPKCNICDAPIIKTSDNYFMVNPFAILSDYIDTRHLNYLRKFKNSKYTDIKSNISERHFDLIIELIKKQMPNIYVIKNFSLNICNNKSNKKNSRELDIFLFDDKTGEGLYLEIKYYYKPLSFSEYNKLDIELNFALEKMPKQLQDLKSNWNHIKQQHNLKSNITSLNGIITSYDYFGIDVPTNSIYPIINRHMLYKSIINSSNIKDIFIKCKLQEKSLYVPIIKDELFEFEFAGITFTASIPSINNEFKDIIETQHKLQMEKFFKNINTLETSHKNIDTSMYADILINY